MTKHSRTKKSSERGSGLIETLIGASVTLVAAATMLPLGIISTSTTENHGHLSARTTEYAQDKMEQLLALAYGDTTSDTTVFPANNAGGTGLAIGGNLNPTTPVAGYVDYLDRDGNLLTANGNTPPAGWMYMREWQISSPGVNLKQISVSTVVAVKIGSLGTMPRSTVTTLKSFPF
jgi:hypothetical protein